MHVVCCHVTVDWLSLNRACWELSSCTSLVEYPSFTADVDHRLFVCRHSSLGDGVVGKAPIMSICTHRNSGGVNSVRIYLPVVFAAHSVVFTADSVLYTYTWCLIKTLALHHFPDKTSVACLTCT